MHTVTVHRKHITTSDSNLTLVELCVYLYCFSYILFRDTTAGFISPRSLLNHVRFTINYYHVVVLLQPVKSPSSVATVVTSDYIFFNVSCNHMLVNSFSFSIVEM